MVTVACPASHPGANGPIQPCFRIFRNPSDSDSAKAKARQAIDQALGPCYHPLPRPLGTHGWMISSPGKDDVTLCERQR